MNVYKYVLLEVNQVEHLHAAAGRAHGQQSYKLHTVHNAIKTKTHHQHSKAAQTALIKRQM